MSEKYFLFHAQIYALIVLLLRKCGKVQMPQWDESEDKKMETLSSILLIQKTVLVVNWYRIRFSSSSEWTSFSSKTALVDRREDPAFKCINYEWWSRKISLVGRLRSWQEWSRPYRGNCNRRWNITGQFEPITLQLIVQWPYSATVRGLKRVKTGMYGNSSVEQAAFGVENDLILV